MAVVAASAVWLADKALATAVVAFFGLVFGWQCLSDRRLADYLFKLNRANQNLLAGVAAAIEVKDRYVSAGIARVQEYSARTARELGLPDELVAALTMAAAVANIGKLGVPDHALAKPGKLDPEEFKLIQEHVAISVEILRDACAPDLVVEIVAHHHERWDGLGYPDGKRGDEIPIAAQILSLVQVYVALTAARTYRGPLAHDEAMKVISEAAGKQFSPRLVEAFRRVSPIVKVDHFDRTIPEVSRGLGRVIEVTHLNVTTHAISELVRLSGHTKTVFTRELAGLCLRVVPIEAALVFSQASDGTELMLEACEPVGVLDESLVSSLTAQATRRDGPYQVLNHVLSEEPSDPNANRRVTYLPMGTGIDACGGILVVSRCSLTDSEVRTLAIVAERAATPLRMAGELARTTEISLSDPLTGIGNRRALEQSIGRHVRSGREFTLVLIDVNEFKHINDTLGHDAGDTVLTRIAGTVADAVSGVGEVFRYAGDEFIVLTCHRESLCLVDRLRHEVSGIRVPGLEHFAGISAGEASWPADSRDPDELIRIADARMYTDKRAQRGRQA